MRISLVAAGAAVCGVVPLSDSRVGFDKSFRQVSSNMSESIPCSCIWLVCSSDKSEADIDLLTRSYGRASDQETKDNKPETETIILDKEAKYTSQS